MSTILFWQQALPPKGKPLPTALKLAMSPAVFNHDGSLSSPPVLLGREHLSYLQGLRDGNVEGATDIILAIQAHDQIEIWTE